MYLDNDSNWFPFQSSLSEDRLHAICEGGFLGEVNRLYAVASEKEGERGKGNKLLS